MEADLPLAELTSRLRSGDLRAAELLFARYARRLTCLAEAHLSRRVARRADGEDVVQSVFRTFFRRSAAGEFRIDNSAELWRLLVRITVRKAQATGRRHTAAVRDVAAEAEGGEAWLLEAVSHEPDPAEAAALVDGIEAALRGLPALYGHVLERRLQGDGTGEIAAGMGVSRRTVERALKLLAERLKRSAAGESPGK
jgi:RNA polymerase sigma-70 factor (ECF subfamily)